MANSDGRVVIDVLVNQQAAQQDINRIDALLRDLGSNAGNGLDNALRDRLRDIENDVQDLGGEIEDNISEGFNNAGNATEGLSKKFSMLKVAAAGIFVGLGAAVLDMAKDFDQSVTKIQNSLGTTREEAVKLGDTAVSAWADGFGESVEDVSDSLIQVKQNMKGIGDGAELEGATKKAMALGQTFDADVNEVTRAANNIMKSFGKDSNEAFDLMAKGAQSGLNMSNEMFDNLAEYTPLWGQMGYEAEDMFNTLINASEAGVYNLDYVNDVMKEFQIRLKDGSKGTADAMAQLPEATQKMFEGFQEGKYTVKDMQEAVLTDLEKMDDQVLANQIGVGLFGTKWEDLESKAMYALNGTKDAMKGYEGAADDVVKTLEESFDYRLKKVTRGAQEALKPLASAFLGIAEIALPPIEKAFGVISEKVEGFTNYLKEHSDDIKRIFKAVTSAIGSIAGGAWEAASEAFDGIISFLKDITGFENSGEAFEGIADAFEKLAEHKDELKMIGEILLTVFAAKAVYSGVVGITGAVKVGASAFKTASTAVKGLVTGVKAAGGAAKGLQVVMKALFAVLRLNPIGLVITAIFALIAGFKLLYKHNEGFRDFVDGLVKRWKSFPKEAKKSWNNFVEWLSDSWKSIKKFFGRIGDGAEQMKDDFVKSVKRLKNNVTEGFEDLKDAAIKKVKGLYNGVTDWFRDTRDKASDIVDGVKDSVKDKFENMKDGAISRSKGLYNGVKNWFGDMRDKTTDLTESTKDRVKNKFENMKDGVIDRSKDIYNGVSKWFRNMRDKAGDIVDNAKDKVKRGFKNMKEAVSDIVKDMYENVKKWFDKIFDKAKELPGDMASGIKKGKEKVKDAATSVGNGAREGVNKLIGGVEKGVNFIMGAVGADDVKIKTIPKFATGTGGHSGGPMMVNDSPIGDYKELVKLPDGRSFIPEGRNVVFDAPSGTQVMRADHTRQLADKLGIKRYASGTGFLAGAKDFVSGVIGKADSVFDNIDKFISAPVKFVTGIIFDKLEKIMKSFGAKGLPKDLGFALPKFVAEKAKDWVKGLLEGGAGGGDFGSYQPFTGDFNKKSNSKGVYDYLYDLGEQIVNKFKGKYKGLYISSGLRHTSNNTGGVVSDHTTGLGLDLARGGVRDNSYYHMAKTLQNHPYLKFVVGSNKWSKGGGAFTAYPYAKQSDHSNHLHLSAVGPKEAKNAGGGFGSGGKIGGSAKAWTNDIKRAHKQIYGTNISARGLREVLEQIQTESGGNAKVSQGIYDVNSRNGSGGAKGLLQFIQSTFNNYKVKGHGNIWNGYDQLLALFNVSDWYNAITRAGPGKGWSPRSGRVVGYANGTNNASRGLHGVNENGEELMFFNGGEAVVPHELSKKALASAFKDMSYNATLTKQAGALITNAARQQQTQQNNNGLNKYQVDEIITAIKQAGSNKDVIINLDGREFVRVVNARQAHDLQQINYFGG